MAITKQPANRLFLFYAFMFVTFLIQGFASQPELPHHQEVPHLYPSQREQHFQNGNRKWRNWNSRRLMIGSTTPTCSYNECRGCKYKCIAEQIPVDGNDPINSAYHYKCVCHRSSRGLCWVSNLLMLLQPLPL